MCRESLSDLLRKGSDIFKFHEGINLSSKGKYFQIGGKSDNESGTRQLRAKLFKYEE